MHNNLMKRVAQKNGRLEYTEKRITKEYEVFKDQSPFVGLKIPQRYWLILVNTIFDIKVDRRHKSRVVADGHLTATPTESEFSGLVSLRSLQTCLFIGEADGMEPWATNIINAYLEALTSEKVYNKA